MPSRTPLLETHAGQLGLFLFSARGPCPRQGPGQSPTFVELRMGVFPVHCAVHSVRNRLILHLANRASFTCKTDSFSWGHGPDTLACKARPSSDLCGTSLSVSLSLSLSLSLTQQSHPCQKFQQQSRCWFSMPVSSKVFQFLLRGSVFLECDPRDTARDDLNHLYTPPLSSMTFSITSLHQMCPIGRSIPIFFSSVASSHLSTPANTFQLRRPRLFFAFFFSPVSNGGAHWHQVLCRVSSSLQAALSTLFTVASTRKVMDLHFHSRHIHCLPFLTSCLHMTLRVGHVCFQHDSQW